MAKVEYSWYRGIALLLAIVIALHVVVGVDAVVVAPCVACDPCDVNCTASVDRAVI